MSGVTVKNYLRILSIDIDSTRTTQRRGGTPHHDIVQHNVPIDMRHLDNQRPRKMLELQTVVHGIRHHGHLQQLLMRRRVFPILVRLRQCERERAILIATLNKRCRIRCVIAPPPQLVTETSRIGAPLSSNATVPCTPFTQMPSPADHDEVSPSTSTLAAPR